MNTRTLSTIAIAVFVLLGGIFMGLRYYRLEQARTAREQTLWELQYRIDFEADIAAPPDEARVLLALPFDTPHSTVIMDKIILDPNLRQRVPTFAWTQNRMLELTTQQAGRYRASVEFTLRLSPRADRRAEPPLEHLTADALAMFRAPVGNIIPRDAETVRDTIQLMPDEAQTEAERLQWIFEYCAQRIEESDDAPDDVVIALRNLRGTPKARARAMVTLCRRERIPSRLVTGIRIQQGARIQPQVWVEVFQNQRWVPFDPTAGWSLTLPMNYLPVRRNADQIDGPNANVSAQPISYSIKRLPPAPQLLRTDVQHPLQIFSLTRLPVPMHTILKILLLLPFAALITAFVRNVVGVQTFGTFAPALLAVSFIYSEWKTGLLILIVVVAIGLFGRGFLERLRLLMVPRLSVVLTVVILCVVFGLSALYYVLPGIQGQQVLLPMVILTMLIERFHVSVEEDGLMYTIQLAVGTLVVAILCYVVLRWDTVGAWVLTYPEAHFFTIAAFILLGRYAGYRLTELWRFRDLIEPSEPVR